MTLTYLGVVFASIVHIVIKIIQLLVLESKQVIDLTLTYNFRFNNGKNSSRKAKRVQGKKKC